MQTLDGRVPSVADLRQRKRVLKKALQAADAAKAALKAQGAVYPADKQAQWFAMASEYRELKGVLAAVEAADAQEAEQQAEAATAAAAANQRIVVDLT